MACKPAAKQVAGTSHAKQVALTPLCQKRTDGSCRFKKPTGSNKRSVGSAQDEVWAKKPKLTLGTTSERFRMELVSSKCKGLEQALPGLLPPSVRPDDLNKKQLTVGCDFAGVCGPAIALGMLGVDFEILWCSDNNMACQRMLKYHFGPGSIGPQILGDVEDVVPSQLAKVDIYIATPPCQSFSSAGKQQGIDDARGKLIWRPVQVCKELKPRVVIVENVATLFTRFRSVYQTLAAQLEELGYVLLNKEQPLWNTYEHGVPQGRARVILIGVLPKKGEQVAWTPPAPMVRCPKLSLFVDGTGPRVRQATTNDVIDQALQAWSVQHRRVPEELVIDLAASERFRTCSEHFCPTLTASRAMARTAFYVHSVKACLSKSDKVRLQGYPPHFFHPRKAGVAEGVFGHQMGNAVSGNVMMRLWPAVLKAAGFIKKKAPVRDFWAEVVEICDDFDMCVTVPQRAGPEQKVARLRRRPSSPRAFHL